MRTWGVQKDDECQQVRWNCIERTTSFSLRYVHWIRKCVWKIFVLVVGLFILDVYIFYTHIKPPKINTVEIQLSPNGLSTQSVANVDIQGQINKSSWFTSFDISHAICSFHYRQNNDSNYDFGGISQINFSQSAENSFQLFLQADQIRFDVVRRIYWDITGDSLIHSSMKVDCAATIIIKFLHQYPIVFYLGSKPDEEEKYYSANNNNITNKTVSKPWVFPNSNILTSSFKLRDYQLSPKRGKIKNDKSSTSKSNEFSWKLKSFTTQQLEYDLIFQYNYRKQLIIGGHPISSFIVHWPKVAYTLSLLDRSSAPTSRLVISSESLTVDLTEINTPAEIDLKISCTAPASSVTEAAENINHDCTLFSAANIFNFKRELTTNKFLNISSYSVHKNFISSFFGEHHYLKSIDSAQYVDENSHNNNRLLMLDDPNISSGAECITIDSDGVYRSQTCTEIEKGFFKLYMNIYNAEGDVGYLNYAASWAPVSQEVAFHSELSGRLTYDDTDYSVFGNIFFSESLHSFSAALSVNYSNIQAVSETLSATWNFGASKGSFAMQSITAIEGFDQVNIYSTLNYGDHLYTVEAMMGTNVYEESGQAFSIYGEGSYGGDIYDWYFSLNRSSWIYDNVTQGHAVGNVYSAVPARGEKGLIEINFFVVDHAYRTVAVSNCSGLVWYTNNNWFSNGNVIALSTYQLIDGNSTLSTWNATGTFSYGSNNGDNTYIVLIRNNPLTGYPIDIATSNEDLYLQTGGIMKVGLSTFTNIAMTDVVIASNARTTSSFDDYFLVTAFGSYGGNWATWYVSMDSGILIRNSLLKGSASGNIDYFVPFRGNSGQIEFQSIVLDHLGKNIVVINDTVSWGTTSNWRNDGNVLVHSQAQIFSTPYSWNAKVKLLYEESAYSASMEEGDFDTGTNDFVLYGNGRYGGDSEMLWATLDASQILLYNESVGSATGSIFWSIMDRGKTGMVLLLTNITTQQDIPWVYSNDTVQWQTQGGWTSDGEIKAASIWKWVDDVDWDTSLDFSYGGNAYQLSIVQNGFDDDDDSKLNSEFYCIASGGYGGSSFYNWWVSVQDSKLIVHQQLIGAATLEADVAIVENAAGGWIIIKSNMSNALQNTVYASDHWCSWNSSQSWSEEGEIFVLSKVFFQNTINWNTTGTFMYGDSTYFLMFQEGYENLTDQKLLIYGTGRYGGKRNNWWATLSNSKFIYNQKLVGQAEGIFEYEDKHQGRDANILLTSVVTDSIGAVVLTMDDSISWNSSTSWKSSGNIYVKSRIDIHSVLAINASGSFHFMDDQFFLRFVENDVTSSSISNTLEVNGTGKYGGSWNFWFASLDEINLFQNYHLLGTCTGEITGITPKDWSVVSVSYNLAANDFNTSAVLTMSGNVFLQSNSSWSGDGVLDSAFQMDVRDLILWKGLSKVYYTESAYEITFREESLTASAKISGDSSIMIATIQGNYGTTLLKEGWVRWVSVTNSLVLVDENVLMNLRGYIQGYCNNAFEEAQLIVNLVDYASLLPSQSYSATEIYPVENSSLWTQNKLQYSYDGGILTKGIIYTDSSWNAAPLFALQSLFFLRLIDNYAHFAIKESLYGKEGLDMWANATYNEHTGMIADMGGEVSYANTLILSTNVNYDLQLVSYIEPSSQPSSQPSSSPSSQPTMNPSCQPSSQPSSSPSTQPTMSPSSGPTLVPTARPSTSSTSQPSSTPTSYPTVQPSCQPSSAPTSQPTQAPTELRKCPQGTYIIPLPVMANCSWCPAGSFAAEGDNVCTQCAPGSYSAEQAGTCILCPLNSYQSKPGSSFCTPCGSGYVTALTGSLTKAECVNPTSSFVFGFFIIGAAMVFIWVYVCKGRLQRIAFLRKERLMKKVIIVAAAASQASDLVTAVSGVIQAVYKEKPTKKWISEESWEIVKGIIFITVSLILLTTIVFLSIFFGVGRVIFNTMVIYRSYRFYFDMPLSFEQQLQLVVDNISNILRLPFITDLAYPFVYVANAITNIRIDLNTVQVSCAGAQAPGLLIINFMIVGLVILIIRSDAQVYWDVAQQKVLSKGISMMFNQYYVNQNTWTTCFHCAFSLGILFLPSPCKIIQYSMGFVTASVFFSSNGRSPSDANCDASFSYPLDTLLATVTTVLVYIVVPPIIYILSQVIVPAFMLRKNDLFTAVGSIYTTALSVLLGQNYVETNESALELTEYFDNSQQEVEERDVDRIDSFQQEFQLVARTKQYKFGYREIRNDTNAIKSKYDKNDTCSKCWNTASKFCSRLIPRTTKLISSLIAVDWLYIKLISSIVLSMFNSYRVFLLEDHFQELLQEGFLSDLAKFSDDQERIETVRLEIGGVNVPHIPWFLAISDVGVKLFGNLSESEKIAERRNEKLLWKRERLRFPNFFVTSRKVRKEMHKWIQETFDTRSRRREYISIDNESTSKIEGMLAITATVIDSVCQHLLFFFAYPASFMFIFQWGTDIGRAVWRRVLQNYLSVFTLAAGCWMEFAVDDFNIIHDYDTFSKLMKTIEKQMENEGNRIAVIEEGEQSYQIQEPGCLISELDNNSDEGESDDDDDDADEVADGDQQLLWCDPIVDERDHLDTSHTPTTDCNDHTPAMKRKNRLHFQEKGEALLKVVNDPAFDFQHFIAAIVSVRVVLLQIVPMFTLASIIAVDAANCPIFVFSKKMNERLPPLLVKNPFQKAQLMLNEDAKFNGESVPFWKVVLLGFFMFVNQSRLIQFLFLPINSSTMIIIVFSPENKLLLYAMLLIVVLEFAFLGLSNAAYMILLFHRWMYPAAKGSKTLVENVLQDELHNEEAVEEAPARANVNNGNINRTDSNDVCINNLTDLQPLVYPHEDIEESPFQQNNMMLPEVSRIDEL